MKAPAALLTLLLIPLVSTASAGKPAETFRRYPGAPLPADAVATLELAPEVRWLRIGEVRIDADDYRMIEWPRGRYRVEWGAKIYVSFLVSPRMNVTDERSGLLELEGGHRYTVSADRSTRTGETYLWIEDRSSGRIVAGAKNPARMTEEQGWLYVASGNDAVARFLRGAREGDVETLRSLVAAGVDVDSRDRHDRSALIYAASYDRTEAIDFLLDHGADVNHRMSPPYEANALIAAATCLPDRTERDKPRCIESVRRLLEQPEIDLGARDTRKRTALMAAAAWARRTGSTEVIEALLERGAAVNAKDSKGMTALDWAKGSAAKKVLRAAGGKRGKEL